MSSVQGQGEFFSSSNYFWESSLSDQCIALSKKSIQDWQNRIYSHQKKCFQNLDLINHQTCLFQDHERDQEKSFTPLNLTPLPINFWRWPKKYFEGPAVYLVMDRFSKEDKNIILYIGETIAAEQRWKGEHDCKSYLSNYSSILNEVSLSCQLSIRFWTDVPRDTVKRRALEQKLIRRWLPPFNKETRTRWQTPFTTGIS